RRARCRSVRERQGQTPTGSDPPESAGAELDRPRSATNSVEGSPALARRGRDGAFAEELAEAHGVARRERLVLVLEVRVDAEAVVEERPQPSRPVRELGLRVGRLAQAQVAEGRIAVEGADHRGASGVDAGPGLVAEVERPLERRVERAEQALQ